jgi:hypothetical protein
VPAAVDSTVGDAVGGGGVVGDGLDDADGGGVMGEVKSDGVAASVGSGAGLAGGGAAV